MQKVRKFNPSLLLSSITKDCYACTDCTPAVQSVQALSEKIFCFIF